MDFLKGIFNGNAESAPSVASGVPGSGIGNATGMVGDIFKGGLNFVTGGISGMVLDGVKGIIAAPLAALTALVAANPVVAGIGVGLFVIYRTRAQLFNFLVRNSGLNLRGNLAFAGIRVGNGFAGGIVNAGVNCLNNVINGGNAFVKFGKNLFFGTDPLDDMVKDAGSNINGAIRDLEEKYRKGPAKDWAVAIANNKDFTKEQKAFSEKFCTLALNILDSIGFFYGIEV